MAHKYGDDASEISKQLGGAVTNIGLVYVDARGISRRAFIKSLGRSAMLGKK